jgi:hypothetical protein
VGAVACLRRGVKFCAKVSDGVDATIANATTMSATVDFIFGIPF